MRDEAGIRLHAVHAAEVAAIRHRYADVIDGPAEAIDQGFLRTEGHEMLPGNSGEITG
jgi:hypothetical protein